MYPGGKNANGTYQVIINQITPHTRYIELCLGSGAILRNKRPSEFMDLGIEINEDIIKKQFPEAEAIPYYSSKDRRYEVKNKENECLYQIKCCDAIQYLENEQINKSTFIYADPPYPKSSRKDPKDIYDYEMTDEQHRKLLKLLMALPANIAISTYKNELYTSMLQPAGWRLLEFDTMTRGGHATEQLWMNYPEPTELHDYRYLGKNFTDRQRIHRKIYRHVRKLQELPILERNAIITYINAQKFEKSWPSPTTDITKSELSIRTTEEKSTTGTTKPEPTIMPGEFVFNHAGVCENPEVIIDYNKGKLQFNLRLCSFLAEAKEQRWNYGYTTDFVSTKTGSGGGSSPCSNKVRFKTRSAAIKAGCDMIRHRIDFYNTNKLLTKTQFLEVAVLLKNTIALNPEPEATTSPDFFQGTIFYCHSKACQWHGLAEDDLCPDCGKDIFTYPPDFNKAPKGKVIQNADEGTAAFYACRDFIIHSYAHRTPSIKEIKEDNKKTISKDTHIVTSGIYIIIQKLKGKKMYYKFLISKLHEAAYPPVVTNKNKHLFKT